MGSYWHIRKISKNTCSSSSINDKCSDYDQCFQKVLVPPHRFNQFSDRFEYGQRSIKFSYTSAKPQISNSENWASTFNFPGSHGTRLYIELTPNTTKIKLLPAAMTHLFLLDSKSIPLTPMVFPIVWLDYSIAIVANLKTLTIRNSETSGKTGTGNG